MTYNIYNKTRVYQKSKVKVIVYLHKETYKFFLPFTDLLKKHWEMPLKDYSRLIYALSIYAEPFWKEGVDKFWPFLPTDLCIPLILKKRKYLLSQAHSFM